MTYIIFASSHCTHKEQGEKDEDLVASYNLNFSIGIIGIMSGCCCLTTFYGVLTSKIIDKVSRFGRFCLSSEARNSGQLPPKFIITQATNRKSQSSAKQMRDFILKKKKKKAKITNYLAVFSLRRREKKSRWWMIERLIKAFFSACLIVLRIKTVISWAQGRNKSVAVERPKY